MINGIFLETYAYGTVTIANSCFEPAVSLWHQGDSSMTTSDIYSPCNATQPLMGGTTTTTYVPKTTGTEFETTTTVTTTTTSTDSGDVYIDQDVVGISGNPLEMIVYCFANYTVVTVVICIILFLVCVSCLMRCAKINIKQKKESLNVISVDCQGDHDGGSKVNTKQAGLVSQPTAGIPQNMDMQGADQKSANTKSKVVTLELEGVEQHQHADRNAKSTDADDDECGGQIISHNDDHETPNGTLPSGEKDHDCAPSAKGAKTEVELAEFVHGNNNCNTKGSEHDIDDAVSALPVKAQVNLNMDDTSDLESSIGVSIKYANIDVVNGNGDKNSGELSEESQHGNKASILSAGAGLILVYEDGSDVENNNKRYMDDRKNDNRTDDGQVADVTTQANTCDNDQHTVAEQPTVPACMMGYTEGADEHDTVDDTVQETTVQETIL